jgi:multicomponent Na+:H+ antiporter subunit B
MILRRKNTLGFIAILTLIFLYTHLNVPKSSFNESYQYYITHFIRDTGAQNAVAAIYLNYRFFDTLFEALMLLVGVIGTIYFSRYGEGENDE